MDDRKKFGRRITSFRADRQLAMAELARRAGVSKPTVWAWEREKTAPRSYRIAPISRILGATPDDLLFGTVGTGRAELQRAIDEEIGHSRSQIAALARTTPGKIEIKIRN